MPSEIMILGLECFQPTTSHTYWKLESNTALIEKLSYFGEIKNKYMNKFDKEIIRVKS